MNQPPESDNIDGSVFGPGSSCFVHGRSWTRTRLSTNTIESEEDDLVYGSGCYKVKFQLGVFIIMQFRISTMDPLVTRKKINLNQV